MININRYTPLLILFLTIAIAIIYRSPVFLGLTVLIIALLIYKGFVTWPSFLSNIWRRGEQLPDIQVTDGLVISKDRVIGVVSIEDVPFDYRDLSDSSLRSAINSFHKVLNLGTQVDMVLKRTYVDQRSFLKDVLNKIQNLRIVIENDPSNAKAKRELEILQSVLDRINSGEVPFSFKFFLLIHGKDTKEVTGLSQVIIKGMESLNMKARLATRDEIYDLLVLKPWSRGNVALPSQMPFMTPFAITKAPKVTLWEGGIYMGREIERGFPVFWNVERLENPHIIVIGPTGSGKTEFLIKEGALLSLIYQVPTVFFDSKGDIRARLFKYGLRSKVLNPLFYSINLLNLPDLPNQLKPLTIEKIVGLSFGLTKVEMATLFKSISETVRGNNGDKLTWGSVLANLRSQESGLRSVLERVINVVSELDHDGPPLLDNIEKGINVIDLSQIREESLRRLVMYSVISSLYARFSKTVDEGLRIAIVIDEAWTILRGEELGGIVMDLIKRGRGHGIALLMATQNLQDLGEKFDVFMENIGTLCFMNNGDKKYWTEVVKRYATLLDSDVDTKLSFLSRGEMLVRFLGDPRPLLVRTEPLVGGPLQD